MAIPQKVPEEERHELQGPTQAICLSARDVLSLHNN